MKGPKSQYFDPKRFEVPNAQREIQNPYDMTGPVIDDLIRRKVQPVLVFERISLAQAGERTFLVPGRALVLYGHDGSEIRTVNTTAFASVQFEVESYNSSLGGFPMKHARGFRGPFSRFAIKWPAQSGVYIDVVVHQFEGEPWVDGEAAT